EKYQYLACPPSARCYTATLAPKVTKENGTPTPRALPSLRYSTQRAAIGNSLRSNSRLLKTPFMSALLGVVLRGALRCVIN
ncbi:MAG: hypothetical protein Q8Q76_12960, partial [Methylotenera sp.]|nr:hypothetical protein [Methylotenera sp.]